MDQNLHDPVSADSLYRQNSSILERDRLAVLRQALELLDDQSSDRIIVFGREGASDCVIDIIQAHRAVDKVGEVVVLADLFFLILVIFVPDIADYFFNQIFQRDHTDCVAIFIQNESNAVGMLLHFL